MREYVAAALSIVIVTGPAGAVDLGGGIQAGGVGIGTSLGVGREGTSLGVGTSLGGLGGVDAGASVGTSKGVSVGVSGRLDGASGGLSPGTGSASSGTGGVSSAAGAAAARGDALGRSASASNSKGTVAPAAIVAPAEGLQTIALPWILRPSGGSGRMPAAIEAIPGTPSAVVSACREAIESAATPFGMVSVSANSGGTLRRLSQGAVSAPIQVRIHYARQGGAEIRQARIRCQLDATGRVIKLI